MRKIQPKFLTCLRCDYTWQARVKRPKVCPSCFSPYWDKPRIRQHAIDAADKKRAE